MIQVAAQKAIFIGRALGEPEIFGIVPEIAHAEELDADDAGRIHVRVVNSRMDRLTGALGSRTRRVRRRWSGSIDLRVPGRRAPS